MSNKEPAGAAALLAGFAAREAGASRRLPAARTHEAQAHRARDRRRRPRRLVPLGRLSSGNPITSPSLPDKLGPAAVPGAHPARRQRDVRDAADQRALAPRDRVPEQVETGLTDIKGLDMQVDEVVRSLDVFLGYATFQRGARRHPAAGHPVRGTAGHRQDLPGQGDGQAGRACRSCSSLRRRSSRCGRA